ncbi:MAG: phosphate acyltransferase PlsX [Oscillospiraceae bacterium]|nr:phosphate acyltransferase PlsX [Oscillospiraceae bacterium]
MKIIVDAMGGDNAPGEIVRGALDAAREFNVQITLVGRGEDILGALKAQGAEGLPPGVEISHAQEEVTMHDSPATVIKDKPDSSMAVGLKMLAAGEGDAFVSAGSTGALLACSTHYVKRVKGIRRAALSPFLPTRTGGRALLIDCGANAECTPEYLLQFACMGSFFTSKQMKIQNPRVGLLNIGAEENKGTSLQREAYALLNQASRDKLINFVGNIEARDVPLGAADVVVADGYSGNILLKAMEGTGMLFAGMLKNMLTKNILTKLAAAMLSGGIRGIKKTMDYTETGGSPLLGLMKPVIKAHGSANAKCMKNAVLQAKIFAEANVIEAIQENIEKMKAGAQEI